MFIETHYVTVSYRLPYFLIKVCIAVFQKNIVVYNIYTHISVRRVLDVENNLEWFSNTQLNYILHFFYTCKHEYWSLLDLNRVPEFNQRYL